MSEEEMLELHPSTWPDVAHFVNDYMELPCGRVVYEEATAHKVAYVDPTLMESIYDLLHLRWPRMRKDLIPVKYAVIKVLDEYGKPLVHSTFDPDSLYTFNPRRIMDIGRKLKRVMEAK